MNVVSLSWGAMFFLNVGEVVSTGLDICRSYRNLSDPWRNLGFISESFPGWPKNDLNLVAGWYRFTGIGGDELTTVCPFRSTISMGGTRDSFALCKDQTYPAVGNGVKTMQLCQKSNCSCSGLINVTACPGGFYLYHLFPTHRVFVTGHRLCKESSCGEHANCTKDGGCDCLPGFKIPSTFLPTGDSYGCQVLASACPNPCGANAQCEYFGSKFQCSCRQGFKQAHTNPFSCKDVNECEENLRACGHDRQASCVNIQGGFQCKCPSGYIPTPDLDWKTNVTVCKDLNQYLKGKSSGVDHLLQMIQNTTSGGLTVQTVSLLLDKLANDSDRNGPVLHENNLLNGMQKLVSQLARQTHNETAISFASNNTEVRILSTGPDSQLKGFSELGTSDVSLDINLLGIAKNNKGVASVALMSYNHMQDVLNAGFFHTRRNTTKTMMSRVVSAILLDAVDTRLPDPVKFTFGHVTDSNLRGKLTCVYWNVSSWIEDGCHVTETNSTHTVCSCEHLSTFALIMQTTDQFLSDPILNVLNTVFVLIGLVFLTLAVTTFALCRWNPRVSNVARLNLCVCLLLAHPLFLLTQHFLYRIWPLEVLCKVLSGVLQFLFLCCFTWMSMEAVLLFLSVRKLKQIKPNERVGPHWTVVYLIGYGIPLIIVGVSAGVRPDGYGSLQCWLKTEADFKWSFLGPVSFILAGNIILYVIIFFILFFTLREAQTTVSKVSYTRILAVKLMFQFFILGCPWVLGFFVTAGKAVEGLFVVLNSQQGTFIFLVHCALNDEIRRQYRSWWQDFRRSSDPSSATTGTTMPPSFKEGQATGVKNTSM